MARQLTSRADCATQKTAVYSGKTPRRPTPPGGLVYGFPPPRTPRGSREVPAVFDAIARWFQKPIRTPLELRAGTRRHMSEVEILGDRTREVQ